MWIVFRLGTNDSRYAKNVIKNADYGARILFLFPKSWWNLNVVKIIPIFYSLFSTKYIGFFVKRFIWSECWSKTWKAITSFMECYSSHANFRFYSLMYVSGQTQAPTRSNVESRNLWNARNVLKTQSFVTCAVDMNLAWNLTKTKRCTMIPWRNWGGWCAFSFFFNFEQKSLQNRVCRPLLFPMIENLDWAEKEADSRKDNKALKSVTIVWNIYEIIHICTAVVDESEVWSSQ